MARIGFLCVLMFAALALPFARAQETPGPTTYVPNQEIRVPDLPAIRAASKDAADVMPAAVETILHDKDLCCGKDSALEDAVLSADPSSLKSLGLKLQGRQHLSDGRPLQVTAEFVAPSEVSPSQIIGTLRQKRALLMQWNSHVYVLYGAVFDGSLDSSTGVEVYAVRKLLLLDPRFSDDRREATFNRDTDDWNKVQGMLTLTVALP